LTGAQAYTGDSTKAEVRNTNPTGYFDTRYYQVDPNISDGGRSWYRITRKPAAEPAAGKTDIIWDQPADWKSGSVPTTTSLVNISNNQTVTVPTGTTAECLSLNLDGNATVTVEPGALLKLGDGDGVTGNGTVLIESDESGTGTFLVDPKVTGGNQPKAKVEMFTKARHTNRYYWQHFGIPARGDWNATTGQYDNPVVTTSINPMTTYIYRWVSVQSGGQDWVSITGWNELNRLFAGYNLTNMVADANGITYYFEGNLMGNEDAYLDFAHLGYNVMGNSYTAPIDLATLFSKLDADNIEGTVWIYDLEQDNHATITAFKVAHGMSSITAIAPMQGFIMKLTSGTPMQRLVSYKDAVWDHASNAGLPLMTPNRAQSDMTKADIVITSANSYDVVELYELDDFSDEFDNGADASKLEETGLNFYANTEAGSLSIVATDHLLGTNLSIRSSEDINYTMTFAGVSNMDYAILDTQTNAVIPIVEGNSYSFVMSTNTTMDNRFCIVPPQDTPTDIGHVEAADAVVQGIYSVSGRYMGAMSEWNLMPKGVYIVNGQKWVK